MEAIAAASRRPADPTQTLWDQLFAVDLDEARRRSGGGGGAAAAGAKQLHVRRDLPSLSALGNSCELIFDSGPVTGVADERARFYTEEARRSRRRRRRRERADLASEKAAAAEKAQGAGERRNHSRLGPRRASSLLSLREAQVNDKLAAQSAKGRVEIKLRAARETFAADEIKRAGAHIGSPMPRRSNRHVCPLTNRGAPPPYKIV